MVRRDQNGRLTSSSCGPTKAAGGRLWSAVIELAVRYLNRAVGHPCRLPSRRSDRLLHLGPLACLVTRTAIFDAERRFTLQVPLVMELGYLVSQQMCSSLPFLRTPVAVSNITVRELPGVPNGVGRWPVQIADLSLSATNLRPRRISSEALSVPTVMGDESNVHCS